MRKIIKNKSLMMMLFLAIFSFSISLFDNYRQLWLKANDIPTMSISRIITIASIITALCLFFFSLKVSTKKLKNGITVALLLKLITSTLLILFNNSGNPFFIKFITFFDIAFIKIISSSIYPLMLNLQKSDELFTKREVIGSLGDKMGLFFASFLLGKGIGSFIIDYNKCLLLSVIFSFIAFIILISFDVEGKEDKQVSLKETFNYFNNHKFIYLFYLVVLFGQIAWSSILGLKILSLTETIGLSTNVASYIILGFGLATNLLAMLIVKYLKFKNDYINVFFKYGARMVFYVMMIFMNDTLSLFITFAYLLLTDVTFNFVFSGFIANNIEEKYVLIYSVFKYSITLIGNGIGVYLCGLTFNLEIKYIGLVTFVFALITYILANILVSKKIKYLNSHQNK